MQVTSSILCFLAVFLLVCDAFQPKNLQDPTSCWNRRDALVAAVLWTTVPPKVKAAYQGVYVDPSHPKGYRILVGDDQSAVLKLQDDPKGEEYKVAVRVTRDKTTQQIQLVFDSSTSGGPGMVGTIADDKITFPDGTAWSKDDSGIVGVYRDSSAGGYATIRNWKGAELRVELITGSETTASFGAKAGSKKAFFEYPGEFNKAGFIDGEEHTITFRDGTVWTRF